MNATQTDTPTRNGLPRVYTGRSVEELIPRIERELGHDAIVTRQRTGLGGGVAGFFQRPFVEIEAHAGHPRVDLYDEPTAREALPPASGLSAGLTAAPAPALPAPAPASGTAAPAPAARRFAAALAEAQTGAPAFESLVPDVTPPVAPEMPAGPAPASPEQSAQPAVPAPRAVPAAPSAPAKASRPRRALDGAAQEAHAKLLARGVERELADEVIELAGAHALALAPPDASFADAVAAVLRRRIGASALWPAAGTSVAIVGPGGAGKTSFCAALAGAYRERSALPVACATLLSGGAEREHTLLLSPHLLTPTPLGDERARAALERARGEGMLLLDTPAAPVADRAAIVELAKLLERLRPDHVVLALPATFGARAGAQLLRAMRPLRPTSVAITHAHETDQLGAAVGAACAAALAPAFLLDQRRGGAGLLQTDPADLAERLLA